MIKSPLHDKGFTLIEIVTVLIVLSIISVVAITRFVNLKSSASSVSVTNVAAALSAASANNFAARTANSSAGLAMTNCPAFALLLPNGALPSSAYSITPDSTTTITSGTAYTCTLNGPNSTSATFRALAIS